MSKPTYAHLPGGGPSGATCMTCEHRGTKEHQGRSIHWCGKAARFTDTKPSQMGAPEPAQRRLQVLGGAPRCTLTALS